MESILTQIEDADALVLGSPVNCGNVTAIFRRFMERLMVYSYWPWNRPAPSGRTKKFDKESYSRDLQRDARLFCPTGHGGNLGTEDDS